MSDHLHVFAGSAGRWAVSLPFELDERLKAWGALRTKMIGRPAAGFSRDEWAYLVTFLDPANLARPFEQAFGARQPADGNLDGIARPRGGVAVWLPSNVSLLGPLTFVLLGLVGVPVRLKASAKGDDLTEAFVAHARQHAESDDLCRWLDEQVTVERFDRDDPRNATMAAGAAVRIAFGSDEAVAAVDALPHPDQSIGFSFSDRRSEAWLEPDCIDDDVVDTIIRIFAVFGRAGCTSPQRVVVLEDRPARAHELRDRLVSRWPQVIRRDVAMHAASECIMARQHAAAIGLDAITAPRHAGVLIAADHAAEAPLGNLTLTVTAAPLARAIAGLPDTIQTIGHAVTSPRDRRWATALAPTNVKRFVPIKRMHHFGPTWDGWAFWRSMFEEMVIEA